MPEQPKPHTPPDAPAAVDADHPYTRPGITLVGNMNDLLGGSGSHNSDGNCESNSEVDDPACIG